MTNNRASITFIVPGHLRVIAASVVLADLARKLGDANLAAGRHEIVILNDGSVMLNGTIYWRPKPSTVEPKKIQSRAKSDT